MSVGFVTHNMRKGLAVASDMLEKWGDDVAGRGFAQVPNYLLFLNQFLDEEQKLPPLDLLILVELVGAWWKKADAPFPSMRTLAQRCGTSERQVQRAMARLEAKSLVKRLKRRDNGLIASNSYDLTPLADVLRQVAKSYPNAFPRSVR
jgi:AraC-like DNA-binding protein